MIPKLLTTSLAAGAAALGFAAAAHAATLPVPSDPAFAVPQGKIEHTIVEQQVSGSKALASRTRTETWLTATHSHTLVYDAATGKLTAETSSTPTEVRAWTAEDGVIEVERRKTPGPLIENSTEFEAAVQKAYLEQGITRVIGETTVGGRRALVTESVPEKWRTDESSQRTTAVVDALTYTLYSRTSTLPNGAFTQTQTWRSELLDGAQSSGRAKMAMKRHAGAKIRRR